tara:strand:- start:641 stop:1003 length:363 start_codon:yes stop_codon:yes gene_type:complete
MESIKIIIQAIIALGIFYELKIQLNNSSINRGGNSQNMESEFKSNDFKNSFLKILRFSKLSLACILIIGIWFSNLVDVSAFLIGCLMIGTIGDHLKTNDSLNKSLPAFIILTLTSALIIL